MNFKLYTDGGIAKVNPSPIGGASAWILTDSSDTEIMRDCLPILPGGFETEGVTVSNNNTELAALCYGLIEAARYGCTTDGNRLTVYSDSGIALGWVFKGFKTEKVPDRMLWILSRAKMGLYGACVEYVLLAGHPTAKDLAQGFRVKDTGVSYPVHPLNVECDRLCTEACRELVQAQSKDAEVMA